MVKEPKKDTTETVAAAVRLPRETHDWLKSQPAGITDSIKRGLELLAIEQEADEPTRSAVHAIFDLAREVAVETGSPWHADAGAYRTFRRAIVMILAKWRPPGVPDSTFEAVSLPPFEQRARASHPTNDTDELGVYLAHDVLETPERDRRDRIRTAREKTLQEVIKVQQQREEI